MNKWILALWLFLLPALAQADAVLKLQSLGAGAYAIVGPLGDRTPENLGNNANFGFMVTPEGVVLIDPGGSYQGAAEIHRLVRSVTDQPVKIVINTGGQDHRWLGNGYFRERGATIIASERAVADQRARAQDQLFVLGNLIGDAKLAKTEPLYADETFAERRRVQLGGVSLELIHVGPAHTPGDTLVWWPKVKLVFTGDVVYVDRMLGVTQVSKIGGWIAAFEALSALAPARVVPGHGPVTDLPRARAHTYDYLVFLRDAVSRYMEGGGTVAGVGEIDQTRFRFLENYDSLAGRNAQQVYEELEWN